MRIMAVFQGKKRESWAEYLANLAIAFCEIDLQAYLSE